VVVLSEDLQRNVARTLRCRSSDNTTTACERRYVKRSNQDAKAMTVELVMAPVATTASGNTSCTLKINRVRRNRAAIHPTVPRVSGGDMATTASTRFDAERRPTSTAHTPAMTLKATNDNARPTRLDLDFAGNGLIRVIEPHGVTSLRTSLPPQPSSIRCSRYHGNDVTT
jgi:hypothetical protein